VRSMSLENGAVTELRSLPSPRAYLLADFPVGWSGNGESLFVQTMVDTNHAVAVVPVRGGAERRFVIPSPAWRIRVTADARYVYIFDGHPRDSVHHLSMYDAISRQRRLVSGTAVPIVDATIRAPHQIAYGVRHGDSLSLRVWSPELGERTLVDYTARAADVHGPGYPLALHDDRLVFERGGRDTTRLMLVSPRVTQPVQVLAVNGHISEAQWSPDGRTIVADVVLYAFRDTTEFIGFVPMNGDRPEGAPRLLGIRDECGGLTWLRDSRSAVYYTCDAHTSLWRIENRTGARPALVGQDTHAFWDILVSPDGKSIVYGGDAPSTSTIWRVDLAPRVRH
jgi:hypothetical protein